MYQNVTLKLDKVFLKKAKAHAVQHNTSLSRLMVEALMSFINQKDTYQKSHTTALKLLDKGLNLGFNSTTFNRNELHDRR